MSEVLLSDVQSGPACYYRALVTGHVGELTVQYADVMRDGREGECPFPPRYFPQNKFFLASMSRSACKLTEQNAEGSTVAGCESVFQMTPEEASDTECPMLPPQRSRVRAMAGGAWVPDHYLAPHQKLRRQGRERACLTDMLSAAEVKGRCPYPFSACHHRTG